MENSLHAGIMKRVEELEASTNNTLLHSGLYEVLRRSPKKQRTEVAARNSDRKTRHLLKFFARTTYPIDAQIKRPATDLRRPAPRRSPTGSNTCARAVGRMSPRRPKESGGRGRSAPAAVESGSRCTGSLKVHIEPAAEPSRRITSSRTSGSGAQGSSGKGQTDGFLCY